VEYKIVEYRKEVLKKMVRKFKYGKPLSKDEMPKPRKRLPQYDECLREFLKSGHDYWKVNIDALPSKNIKVILSSLKWRTKHNDTFRGIRVFSKKDEVYLEKVKKE